MHFVVDGITPDGNGGYNVALTLGPFESLAMAGSVAGAYEGAPVEVDGPTDTVEGNVIYPSDYHATGETTDESAA